MLLITAKRAAFRQANEPKAPLIHRTRSPNSPARLSRNGVFVSREHLELLGGFPTEFGKKTNAERRHIMPRFFIDTFDHIDVIDETGTDLPSLDAAKDLVQRALAEMIVEEGMRRQSAELRAVVRDETGYQVLAATMTMGIEWAAGKAAA